LEQPEADDRGEPGAPERVVLAMPEGVAAVCLGLDGSCSGGGGEPGRREEEADRLSSDESCGDDGGRQAEDAGCGDRQASLLRHAEPLCIEPCDGGRRQWPAEEPDVELRAEVPGTVSLLGELVHHAREGRREELVVVGIGTVHRYGAIVPAAGSAGQGDNALPTLSSMVPRTLRDLPSIDRVLADERLAAEPHELVVAAARAVLERAREEIQAGGTPAPLVDAILDELARVRRPSLRRVLNATGVLVHTNLGRAPLSARALERVAEVGAGYSNLEYDLAAGARGSRQEHLGEQLSRLTGAEAALVVNNNAAAVLLALAALAEGREVVVSRGELIEIGDGFRIPDVLARSGARLVEVGTTNRTRAADYERAIGPETAVVLRVHQSNFRVVGFTEQPALTELAQIARAHELPLLDDLGSGALAQLGDEPTPAESLRAGADLVTFSGDKLLGGPQAGIVVGRADLIERLRRHPLQRALRADKLTLAALEGTLALALDPARAQDEIPILRMIHESVERVRERAERLAALVGGEVEETMARIGGGALPLAELPSVACAVEEQLAAPLRVGELPVVAVVRDGRTLLDCRTLTDGEVEEVAAAVAAARKSLL
jgi:L-seryl-tRNA(Ser) seleniumtransferase